MIDNGKNNRQNSIIQQRSSDYERKKIWVETIIDAFDLETTKEIARKAVEFGTDWISVGTNNMYACGFMHSIPAVKEIAGDIPVVADIKIHDGGNGFSVQAQKMRCGLQRGQHPV